MKKYFKNILFILVLLISFILVGCKDNNEKPNPNDQPEIPVEHEHIASDWIDEVPFTCGETGFQYKKCIICGIEMDSRRIKKTHEYEETVIQEATCTENGKMLRKCKNCGNEITVPIIATGHSIGKIITVKSQTPSSLGEKEVRCEKCGKTIKKLKFVNNGYNFHGELRVEGRDLVDSEGMPVQLYGLSTHGLQWFGDYTNFDTIANIQENFGINVIRFAFYTDEDGYCDGSEVRKKHMLEALRQGIDFASKLGLYVIIDWHMVGANNVLDKNPLTYLEESKEFFSMISKECKYKGNVLFEIMNEPNGSTTWADCKKYAEEVIPCIRENSDGVILVGNPNWTADLLSVMNDPLDTNKYTNIMYTYHFYARGHRNQSQVMRAYDKGFPVFISEYGFMDADGDGPLDFESGERWLKVCDDRNISYVAWSISNSKGSASIFKEGSYNNTDVSDANLKEWGIYLKKLYQHKSGLDKYI